MVIHGLHAGKNDAVNNIGQNNTRKVSQADAGRKTDSVKLSVSPEARDAAFEALVSEMEFEPRIDLVESISRRIDEGTYETHNMFEPLVEKIIEADVLSDVVNNDYEFHIRGDRISGAEESVDARGYEEESVVRVIADRLVDVLGLADILGGNSGG